MSSLWKSLPNKIKMWNITVAHVQEVMEWHEKWSLLIKDHTAELLTMIYFLRYGNNIGAGKEILKIIQI